MNNLCNYFRLVIIGGQVYRFDQILNSQYCKTPNNVKPIHRRMENYMWHLMNGLIHGEVDVDECG
jgi:hypothetical protein